MEQLDELEDDLEDTVLEQYRSDSYKGDGDSSGEREGECVDAELASHTPFARVSVCLCTGKSVVRL